MLAIGSGSLGIATAAGASTPPSGGASGSWTVNWASGITFGSYGNVGPRAVADCTVATVGDIEQILEHRATPLPAGPYLAAYRSLARAAGEIPGATAGLVPSAVLNHWRTTGIAGTRITTSAPVPTIPSRIEAAVATGPLYAVLNLPEPASDSPVWVNTAGVALTDWSSAHPPAGYSGSGEHVVAVVGYNATDVLVVTWGYVQPISWSVWQSIAATAWRVAP